MNPEYRGWRHQRRRKIFSFLKPVWMASCMSLRVLTQLKGCTNSSREKRKGSGGQLRNIYPIYSSWGAEKDKTPNYGYISRLLSGQDARMGFHICIVGYVLGIPVSLFWEALMIRLFLSFANPALRKACQRCDAIDGPFQKVDRWSSRSKLACFTLQSG